VTSCERWSIKINEGKTQAIYFSHRLRSPESHLTLNGQNIPFRVKDLGVIFDKRITWRLHIEIIEAKTLRTFIRIHPLFKSERLSANIELTLHKALIRSDLRLSRLGISGWRLPLKIAAHAKQGSAHHWKFSKEYTGPRFVHSFQTSLCIRFFFQWLYSPCGPWPLYFSFLIYTRAVGLLERVISTSQGLYLNIWQHNHRKTHIHTII
jgi:hypothetical protein